MSKKSGGKKAAVKRTQEAAEPKPDEIQVICKYAALVPIAELKTKFNPDNPNKHPQEQLERIAKIFKYNGIRKAAVISERSDLLTIGHGRIMAAEQMGMTYYPVEYQPYLSFEHEYADMVADNALQEWSGMNLASVNAQVPELGPDFDLDVLGLKDFTLDAMDKFDLDDKPDTDTDAAVKLSLNISFPNESDMQVVHDELLGRGYIVKVVNG